MDAVVVAGGAGRRFGGDKVVAQRAGHRQVDVVVAGLRGLSGEVVVACGARSLGVTGTREVVDDPDLRGPLAGVVAGLAAVAAGDWHVDGELAAVVAADLVMPSVALLVALATHARQVDVPGVMPVVAGRPQPLHAVVAPSLAARLRSCAATNGQRLIEAMTCAGVATVAESTWRPWAPQARPGRDIDTPDDLASL